MKRVLTIAIAASLTLAACGSSEADETSAASDEPAADEASAEEPAAEQPGSDEAANEQAAAQSQSEDAASSSSDEPADEPADGGSAVPAGLVIDSLDDVPQVCLDQMADFLREIEPLVSSIDWQTASLGEFEAIADDFEAISDDFDEREAESGCDDMEFEGDREFELLIGFAEDVAPGTTGFLGFIDSLGAFAEDGADTASDDDIDMATGDGFADCDEAIAWVQGLMDEYDSFMEVPAAEIMRFAEISMVAMSCTPEQLEFFDTDEVAAFLDGA